MRLQPHRPVRVEGQSGQPTCWQPFHQAPWAPRPAPQLHLRGCGRCVGAGMFRPLRPAHPHWEVKLLGGRSRGRLGAGGSTGGAGEEEWGAGLLPRHGGGLQCPPHRLCRRWTARRVGKRPPPCRHASDHQLAHPQGEEAIVQPDPQHPYTWVACGTGVPCGWSGGEGPPGLVTHHSREVVVIHCPPFV